MLLFTTFFGLRTSRRIQGQPYTCTLEVSSIRYSGNLSRVKTFANFAVSRRRHYQWACHYSRQRRQRRDHGCCFPLPGKEVFFQQQLAKPPRRRGSHTQREPLRSALAIREIIFSPARDSHYTVYARYYKADQHSTIDSTHHAHLRLKHVFPFEWPKTTF